MKRLTLLALFLTLLYLLRPNPTADCGPLPWPLGGARWRMECDYIEVRGRVS